MDGIITGEGVLLDARPTSAATRLLAALLDLMVLGVGLFVLFVALGAVAPDASEEMGRILVIVLMATVTVVIPTTVETLTRGRSLGKLAMGIRIVRDDGGPLVFRQALVRALTGVVELWFTLGTVALICSIVHPQGKRVGDILAGTYAVRVRGAAKVRTPVLMPPQLAGWAHTADLARLPDGLALSVRQFLGRAASLHPASRVQLGSQLTAEVQRYVNPLPPVGTHPEAFLAAVLAERRERETVARLRADQRAAVEASQLQRLPHGIPDPVN
ncbi:RDD family protein [Cellulomonas fengjieae]|uniref:RDD family protein n=1 Tax=Cellulomonas fengjieae TaxID=2819978 RepID=A0ABS3SDP5_9CELL|nr:RDD family protein [Cellulomonas fengjieae]MBO3083876.1 RDD family protein [Cellulomonas fengjieae]QVI64840.1 RDD family protein [Cellulomonas fengjieae]